MAETENAKQTVPEKEVKAYPVFGADTAGVMIIAPQTKDRPAVGIPLEIDDAYRLISEITNSISHAKMFLDKNTIKIIGERS